MTCRVFGLALLVLGLANLHPSIAADQPFNFKTLGYYRIATVAPKVALANPKANAATIFAWAKKAEAQQASVVLFPELSLTGYTAEDLFLSNGFLEETKSALAWLVEQSRDLKTVLIVGAPYLAPNGRRYNTAFIVASGAIIGAVPKSYIPNSVEYYEKRWFVPGKGVTLDVKDAKLGSFRLAPEQIFQLGELRFSVEICEDLWAPFPPSSFHAVSGANAIFNMSSSHELIGKAKFRRELVSQQSARLKAAYIYVSSGPTESTKDLVFSGHALLVENGMVLNEGERFAFDGAMTVADIDVDRLTHERARNMTFSETPSMPGYKTHTLTFDPLLATLTRTYSAHPFYSANLKKFHEEATEALEILSAGLARRLIDGRMKRIILGVSGGLDSTLALLVARRATEILDWPVNRILAVTMPGFGTTERTKSSAVRLIEGVGAEYKEIDIREAVLKHFKDIEHDPNTHDVVFENAQARERYQILFDLSSKLKGLVLGTDDLTELALGWDAYGGDHMYGYGSNGGVPKTLVRALVQWYAKKHAKGELRKALIDVVETPISPELLPATKDGAIAQLTESIVGPHELHDFFIFHHQENGFSPEKIYHLALRTFQDRYSEQEIYQRLHQFYRWHTVSQYKRSAMPPGNPKIGPVSMSQRADLRMPDEASCEWLLRGLGLARIKNMSGVKKK